MKLIYENEFAQASILSILILYLTYLTCKRIPHSWFYELDVAELERLSNLYRQTSSEALDEIKNWKKSNLQEEMLYSKSKELCIAVMHQTRKEKNFLLQTITSMLVRNKYRANDFDLTIININNVVDEDLSLLEKTVKIEPLPVEESFLTSPAVTSDAMTKEIADFLRVLKFMQNKNCKHVGIFEDDCLAATDWLDTTFESIEKTKKWNDRWLYLKLFRPTDFLGWGKENVLTFVFMAFLFSLIFTFIFAIFLNLKNFLIMRKKAMSVRYPSIYSYIIFFVCGLIFVKFTNRQVLLLDLKESVSELHLGYSNVAVIFSPTYISALYYYIFNELKSSVENKTPIEAKDTMCNKFLQQFNLVELVANPSIFQHIGLKSSLKWKEGHEEPFKFIKAYDFKDEHSAVVFNPQRFSIEDQLNKKNGN